MPKIIVFDLSQIYTAAHETAKGGKLADASAATVDRCNRMREGYDVAILACDATIEHPELGIVRAPSFRTKIDPPREDPEIPGRRIGYKANRTRRDASYHAQHNRTRDRLRADGYHVFTAPEFMKPMPCPSCSGPGNDSCDDCVGLGTVASSEGTGFFLEADDVMKWIADEFSEAAESALAEGADPANWALRFVTSDMDMAQLVDDMVGIDVLSLHAGIVYNADQVIKKFGVPPSKVAQFKALAGDSSDEFWPFRGAPKEDGSRKSGIGEKTAKELLARFGGDALDAVRACLAEPPPKGIANYTISLIKRGGEAAAKKGLVLATLWGDMPRDSFDFAPVLAGPLPKLPISGDYDPPPPPMQAPGRETFDEYRAREESAAPSTVLDQLRDEGVRVIQNSPSKAVEFKQIATPAVAQDSGGGVPHAKGSEATADPRANAPQTSAEPSPSRGVTSPLREGAADGPPEVIGETVTPKPRVTGGESAKLLPTSAMVLPGRSERFDIAPYGLEPPDMSGAYWLAGKLAEARMFPKFQTKEQILAVILMGRARGFAALTSLENSYAVHGQVAWKAAFIVGTVMASGCAAYLEVDDLGASKCTVITKRHADRGGTGKERVVTYTMDEARAMGYLDPPRPGKDPSSWHKQPEVMLVGSAKKKTARRYYDDIVGGMKAPDDVRDDGHLNDDEME